MLYIKKTESLPGNWDVWFTTPNGTRTYDYGKDSGSLPRLREAREFLLKEQNYLCAYCLQKIGLESSSIEHVLPKEYCKELSTAYTNLIAVCRNPPLDSPSSRLHCDKEKLSKIITPFVFLRNCQVTATENNAYFSVGSDGIIIPKGNATYEHKLQAEAYINTLNLNHSLLKDKRAKEYLHPIIDGYRHIQPHQKKIYWKAQFKRIFNDPGYPFRPVLLIYLSSKCGRM